MHTAFLITEICRAVHSTIRFNIRDEIYTLYLYLMFFSHTFYFFSFFCVLYALREKIALHGIRQGNYFAMIVSDNNCGQVSFVFL